MKRARNWDIACVSALVVAGILVWLPRLRGPLDLRWDAGVYYILGASLAEGKGYRLLNEPKAIQAIQYPPLLPLFIAAHQRLAGTSDPAVVGRLLRISFIAIFQAFIVLAYCLSRRFIGPGFALLAGLATVLHLHTTWLSELLFPELPFALASIVFLLTASGAKQKSRQWLAGAAAIASFLLRSSGIAVLGAWVGECMIERRFKQMAVRAGVALVPVLAWLGYIAHVKHGAEYAQPAYEYQRAAYQYYNVGYFDNLVYIDPFRPEFGKLSILAFVERTFHNLLALPQSLGVAVSVRVEWARDFFAFITGRFGQWMPSFFVDVFPFLVLGGLVLSGFLYLALRREHLIVLYVAGSLALICFTPWPKQFERYLWPLSPLLFIALFAMLTMLRDRTLNAARGRWRTPLAGLVTLVALAIPLADFVQLRAIHRWMADTVFYREPTGKQEQYKLLFYGTSWKHHDDALDWLDRHASPNEIVATSTPHWLYLKTGLTSIMPPFETDVAEAQRLMDSVPVDYLMIDGPDFLDMTRRYTSPVVSAFPQRWQLVYSPTKEGSKIYHRTGDGKDLAHLKTGQTESR